MEDNEIKQKINAYTKKSCLPGAKEVHVRHCNEQVPLDGLPGLCGSICHLIHPDVTVAEFFT